MEIGDDVYVQGSHIKFVGRILRDAGDTWEVVVDFDHDLTDVKLARNVKVYWVPKSWCVRL